MPMGKLAEVLPERVGLDVGQRRQISRGRPPCRKNPLPAYERFPIEYDDADIGHFLRVVQNRLDDWVPMAELAGWCLPLDLITSYRFSPASDACYYLLSRLIRPLLWLGMIEQQSEDDRRARIEDRRYRKTALFGRLLSFKTIRDGGWTIH